VRTRVLQVIRGWSGCGTRMFLANLSPTAQQTRHWLCANLVCVLRGFLAYEPTGDFLMPPGIATLYCVPVEHCFKSFALVLTHQDGWRVVFSGDTRPSPTYQPALN
jgi:hypothetical protein